MPKDQEKNPRKRRVVKSASLITVIGKDEFYERGKLIYEKIAPNLRRHKGKIVAVEVESEEWILGEDELEVAQKAIETFPGKIFCFFRVGSPVVHKFRGSR